MQARQIDLTPYSEKLISGNEVKKGKIIPVFATVDVLPVEWLAQHLLATAVGHNAPEYMKAMDLVGKFRGALADGKDHTLLDLADWDEVMRIINKLRGWGLQDGKMLRRIREAPLIDVEARQASEAKAKRKAKEEA